jgi:hypothetical protein
MWKNRQVIAGPPLLALVAAALIGCLSWSALAGPAKRLDLQMVMYMAGFTAGTMKLSVAFDDDDATTSLRLKSKGVVKMMTGYQGLSEAKSALPAKAWPIPVSYDSAYETSKYDRRIEIRYGPDDGRITDLQTWKRGEPRGSNVPEALRQATIDPLTTILHFRHWILALRNNPAMAKQQTFEVFDGRRRYRLDAGIIARETVDFGGEDLPVFRLKVVMTPLAGFSSKDMLASWSSEDGDRWIELMIRDDDNPVPLQLETKGGALKTSIFLEEICEGEDCTNFSS